MPGAWKRPFIHGIQAWETTGWWGVVSAFSTALRWSGRMVGRRRGFLEFGLGNNQIHPDAVVDGAVAAYEWSTELWANRDKIFDLFKAFADGAVDVAEKLLESLVNLPGDIGTLIKEVVENSREWAGAMSEMMGKPAYWTFCLQQQGYYFLNSAELLGGGIGKGWRLHHP